MAIAVAAYEAIYATPLGSVAVSRDSAPRASAMSGWRRVLGRQARGDARAGRELQRRDHPLGEGRGMIKKPRLTRCRMRNIPSKCGSAASLPRLPIQQRGGARVAGANWLAAMMAAIVPVVARARSDADDVGLGLADAVVGKPPLSDGPLGAPIFAQAPHEGDFVILGLLLGPRPAGFIGSGWSASRRAAASSPKPVWSRPRA